MNRRAATCDCTRELIRADVYLPRQKAACLRVSRIIIAAPIFQVPYATMCPTRANWIPGRF
jgi:hypothetical protein